MGKKVEKQAKKKDEQKDASQPAQQPKQARKQKQSKKKASSEENELFPSVIETRFNDFGSLYEEINKSITDAGRDDVFGVQQKRASLAEKIQTACREVFRTEVRAAQEQIENTQESIKKQISALEGSYDEVRRILKQTEALSEQEIASALSALEEKVNVKKADLERYQQLLDKARNVYN